MIFFSIFQFVKRNSKVSDYQNKKIGFLHYLYITISLFYCCRNFFAYYSLQICHTKKYFFYDQVLNQFYELGVTDGNLFIAFIPVVFFFVYIYWKLHLDSSDLTNLARCYRFIHSTLVKSFETFFDNQYELYEENNWNFALKKKKLKTFFMISLIQKIGFLRENKNKNIIKNVVNKNLHQFKNYNKLVFTWVALESILISLFLMCK